MTWVNAITGVRSQMNVRYQIPKVKGFGVKQKTYPLLGVFIYYSVTSLTPTYEASLQQMTNGLIDRSFTVINQCSTSTCWERCWNQSSRNALKHIFLGGKACR